MTVSVSLNFILPHTHTAQMYKSEYRCRFLESLAWTKSDLTGGKTRGRFANSRTPT